MVNNLPAELKKYKNLKDPLVITNKVNDNIELTNMFANEVIKVLGFDIDDEGYIVDSDVDFGENEEYILFKGKALRMPTQKVLHSTDALFDPYNIPTIMETLLSNYLRENHPNVSIAQIYSAREGEIPKSNCTYGYMKILYDNGAYIVTNNHYRDSTKILEGIFRLESYGDQMIKDILQPYDEWEAIYFTDPNNITKAYGYSG